MATNLRKNTFLVTLLVLAISFSGVKTLGINYGQVGNNLPPPGRVLQLLKSYRITKARIYDTNPQILTAFANSGVELIVTIENDNVGNLMDPQQALQWVNTRIKPYFPSTRIAGIAVGNEVFTGDDTSLMAKVVPAMVSIHSALVTLGLAQYIHVSTPSSLAVLAQSYPPSAGSFRPELAAIMPQFLQFLASTKSPFWINAYTYFSYKGDPTKVSLDYALFNPNVGMVDPLTKLHYDNMLYAQVDAVIFALSKMGFGGLEVKVSETGWPSSGDEDEVGATVENAAMYNKNLLSRQMVNEGTPLRPHTGLEVYLFALFNEDLKPGPGSERNYGLFQPDESMVYNVGLSAMSTISNPGAAASMSLTISSTKESKGRTPGLVYWLFVYLLTFQVLLVELY